MVQHQRSYLRWLWLSVIFAVAGLVAAGYLMTDPAPTLAAGITSTTDQLTAGDELPGIVGSWLVTTTVVKQASTFPSLLTFTGDGIVLADETPSLYETTGHGAWEATGKDSANFTFIALIGSESGALSVQLKVIGSLVYNAAADTWQGPFTIRITDADGAEVLVDEGTFDAVRIAVESLDMEGKETAQAPAALKPGDKIGKMVLAKGPDPLDRNLPPYVAFCNADPMIETGSTVAKPGVYTVESAVPVLPKLAIGFGWATDTEEHLEQHWQAIDTQLYVNGQKVDQEAFGTVDAVIPSSGLPGEDPDKVIDTPLRTWNVILENLQPGPLTLRMVWHVAEELTDSISTTPAGDYDITFKITVDPTLGAPEGEPAPVALIPEQVSVFDAFNAAVNAHEVDKQLSFFADDAVASFPNQPEPNRYAGKDEIRTWLETDADNKIHVETSGVKTSGDTVTATAKLTMADLPPGMTIEGTVKVTVQDGKIQTFTFTLSDATVEQLKTLQQ